MLKENERLYSNFMALVDVTLTLLALVVGYYIRVFTVAKSILYTEQYLILGLLIIPIWFILIKTVNFQSAQKVKNYSVIFLEYAVIIFVGVLLLFVFVFILKLDKISRLAILIFAVVDLFMLSTVKILMLKQLKRKHIKGKDVKQAVLIADDYSESFIEKLLTHKYLGYKVLAIITDSKKIKELYKNRFKIYPSTMNINNFVDDEVVDELIYCKGELENDTIKELIYSCAEIGVTFQLQSDFYSLIASKSQLNYYGEIPLMTFANTPSDYLALSAKRILDYIFSFFALLIFSPFFLLIALAIKLESKGPVFFKQTRVGLNGRKFTIYKFRTMIQEAEKMKSELEKKNEVDGPVFKIKNDPRVTKVGKFLRRSSLDEFPQFINVLKGDMAVVGPRPPIPEEVDKYTRLQRRRLSMKPGITCIWQVSGRNDTKFDEWMKLDLQYIDNWSLRLDIILMLKTVNAIFKRTGY